MTPKRRGRPKVDPYDTAPSVNVNWRLSAKSYDQATRQATAARVTVAEYVRRILSEKIDPRR
jgi:hypothetical protein